VTLLVSDDLDIGDQEAADRISTGAATGVFTLDRGTGGSTTIVGVSPREEPVVITEAFGAPVSATETATHVYADPGTYEATLTIVTEDGATAATTEQVVVDDRRPIAQFQYDTARPITGSSFTLDAGPSVDPEGNLAAYEWRLGEGTILSGETVTHVYDDPGRYTVELTVRDANGKTDIDTRQVTVLEPNEPPVAAFGVGASAVAPGESVGFDAGGSQDDGTIRTYAWRFGDGTDATGRQVTHAYNESGTYDVTLTVFDDRGATSTETRAVVVEADTQPPAATTATARATPTETSGIGLGVGPVVAVVALALVLLLARYRGRL
jgi:PKD repeat protein